MTTERLAAHEPSADRGDERDQERQQRRPPEVRVLQGLTVLRGQRMMVDALRHPSPRAGRVRGAPDFDAAMRTVLIPTSRFCGRRWTGPPTSRSST